MVNTSPRVTQSLPLALLALHTGKCLILMVLNNLTEARPVLPQTKGCYDEDKLLHAKDALSIQLYPGMLVGDLILTEEDISFLTFNSLSPGSTKRVKRKILNFENYPERKWSFPIKYYIDTSSYDEPLYFATIRRALSSWERVTCVRFEEIYNVTEVHEKHLYFLSKQEYGCSSYLGRVDVNSSSDTGLENVFSQPVYLSTLNCFQYLGTSMHEIGHALGLLHETQRPARNDHIVILGDNIRNGTILNFLSFSTQHVEDDNVPYDLGSVMQYPALVYSVDRLSLAFTSLPLSSDRLMVMGQCVEISFYDAMVINRQYCVNDTAAYDQSLTTLDCAHEGYPDPADPAKCICPPGWAGPKCTDIQRGAEGCEPLSGVLNHSHTSHIGRRFSLFSPHYNDNQYLFTAGDQCFWLIQTLPTQQIGWWFGYNGNATDDVILGLVMSRNAGCQAWVEVKTPEEVTGIRFCGLYFNSSDLGVFANITWSHSSVIQVSFRSFDSALESVPIVYRRGFHFQYTIGEKSTSQPEPKSQEETLRAFMNILQLQLNASIPENPEWMDTYLQAVNQSKYGFLSHDVSDDQINGTHSYVYIEPMPDLRKLVIALTISGVCAMLLFILGLLYCLNDKAKHPSRDLQRKAIKAAKIEYEKKKQQH